MTAKNDEMAVTWSELSSRGKISATLYFGVEIFVSFYLILFIYGFIYVDKQDQAKWQASEPQDRAEFEQFFNSPAIIAHNRTYEEDEADTRRTLMIRIKNARVKEKLLAIVSELAEKQKQLEQLEKVDAHTDITIQLTKITDLREQVASSRKALARNVFLARRFNYAPTYDDIYRDLRQSGYSNWTSVIDRIRSTGIS